MPTNITDVYAFTAPVVAPADGDALTAASAVTALQALANRTKFLNDRTNKTVSDTNNSLVITANTFNTGAIVATGNGTGDGVSGSSPYGAGVRGTSTIDNFGVWGSALGADCFGVFGEAHVGTTAAGVCGQTESGYGVWGSAWNTAIAAGFFSSEDPSAATVPSTTAVYARALNGNSTGHCLLLQGNNTRAPLSFFPTSQPTICSIGDLYMTSAGVLKVCTTGSTPGPPVFVSVGAQV